MEWTNDKIINFIKEIEIRPVLWDSSHVDYKRRNKKHDANQELAEKLHCDTTEVLRKWKIILAQYRREKQILNHPELLALELPMHTSQSGSGFNTFNFYEKGMSPTKVLIGWHK